MTNEKTIRSYVKDVESFLQYMEQNDLKIGMIKEVNVRRYHLYLTENGYSGHTLARKNSALRLFFKYARKQGLMTINPMEDIKQPKVTKRESALTKEEITELESVVLQPRDQLLLRLLLHEDVKIAEVIAAKKGDYKETQGILYLGKRAVTISEMTRQLLALVTGAEDDYLITSAKDKPLTESGVYFILKNYFKAIGRSDLRPIDLVKTSVNIG
jgi:site-specific recombinase XerD